MTGAGGIRSCDVLIAGAGIAGSAAAIALARQGCSVIVADRPQAVLETGETLPSSARPLLERLGVWEGFAWSGALPVVGEAAVSSPHGAGWSATRRCSTSSSSTTRAGGRASTPAPARTPVPPGREP